MSKLTALLTLDGGQSRVAVDLKSDKIIIPMQVCLLITPAAYALRGVPVPLNSPVVAWLFIGAGRWVGSIMMLLAHQP